MPLDPLWKRALKAVVEIKDPPPPPPPEPIPQAAYDELDGALKMQERREARQRLTPAPAAQPAPAAGEDPVDGDGMVSFDRVYRQAGVPAVPFTAEQALDMLRHVPGGVAEDTRQQIINATLSALGRSVGGTPEAIVADAARKQAALREFRRTRGDQLVDLTSAAEAQIAALQREIEKGQAVIEKAKRQYDALSGACQSEEARLDTVVDFFSQDSGTHKP